MSFKIVNGQMIPVKGPENAKAEVLDKKSGGAKANADFSQILQGKIASGKQTADQLRQKELYRSANTVRISTHAQQRMNKRSITLREEDMGKISQAMNSLSEKGARESLILYQDSAFIASVQNRTIITAMKADEVDIITNIDSAVTIK